MAYWYWPFTDSGSGQMKSVETRPRLRTAAELLDYECGSHRLECWEVMRSARRRHGQVESARKIDYRGRARPEVELWRRSGVHRLQCLGMG
eukprot:2452256-Pleurochrysis_carterae.AAC.1